MCSLVTPILWQCVNLLLPYVTNDYFAPNRHRNLQNLRYTTNLGIFAELEEHVFEENQKIENGYWMGFDQGMIFGKLISCFDFHKVVSLKTDLQDANLDFLLDHLSNIKCLDLQATEGEIHGWTIKKPIDLRELQLHCTLITDDIFKDLMGHLQLQKLGLLSCHDFSSKTFDCLRLQNDLKSLHLSTYSQDEKLNITAISTLSNLTYLSLCGGKLGIEDFKALCRCLTRLETLDVSNSDLSDPGFAEMPCLTSLRRLCIKNTGITLRSFRHLHGLPLQSFTFSTGMMINLPSRPRYRQISDLNSIQTLQEVIVDGIMSDNSITILNSLCFKAKWTVTYEEERYRFIR